MGLTRSQAAGCRRSAQAGGRQITRPITRTGLEEPVLERAARIGTGLEEPVLGIECDGVDGLM